MELNPHDWHKRPTGTGQEDPCPVCGAPAEGTRKSGFWHRATSAGEGFAFPFIVRKPSHSGWQQAALYPRILSDEAPDGDAPPIGDFAETAAALASIAEAAGPGDTTLALMARASMLCAVGKTFPQIEKVMVLKRRTVATWASQWPEHWQAACHTAETQVTRTVKAQIGTAGILDGDIDEYLDRAAAAERIAARAGAPLLPASDKPTLCTFFESFIMPMRLNDASPSTVAGYRNCLRLWRLITADPPLESITTETLALYRDALSKRKGKGPVGYMTADTVAGRLRHIQAILEKAGPPGRRNRDAKGLIAAAPWIRPPRLTMKLPRVIAPEVFKLVYDATAGMDWPANPGIKPPAWWKALLSIAYNTQLRRRTLFEMRMEEIDWKAGTLRLPAGRFKARRPMIVHLNPAAAEALRGIRTERELVFECPGDSKNFYKWFHRLQDSAGIPRKEHFGLHAIRKTAATVLAGFSPQAAQLALGHTNLATTMNHYINPTSIIGAALDAMPQPFGV